MNKSIFIFLFILSFFVSGCNKENNTEEVFREISISEEINPIRNDNGDFIGIDVNIIIPNNYDKNEILINPDIFDGISQYENIIAGKKYIIDLEIINNSDYSYTYRDNSFTISTKMINNVNNYLDTGVVGFDLLKIYDLYQPYRTKNEALINLIGTDNLDLSDSVIDDKLKVRGYSGISDLANYYLDYYGNKSLYLLAPKIFSGEITDDLETNKQIINLSYNYFYNSLIRFCLIENECYSIGEFMVNDDLKKLNIYKIDSHASTTHNFFVDINNNYRSDLYKYYNFFGDFKFYLAK